jgi:hypothetical protein
LRHSRNLLSTAAWYSDHLALVRRGVARQHSEITPGSNRRLPFTLEMVLYIYRKFHRSRFTHRCARAAAIVFAFCCLLRPSEYLWGTQSNIHVLTASQLQFECVIPSATNPTSSSTFISLADIRGIPWDQVRLLRIHMHSAKNISSRTGSRLWFSASDVGSIHLVRVMYDWGQHAQALPNTPVFSWPTTHHDKQHTRTPQRTNLLYRNFHELLQRTAAYFGFEGTQFGCQSLRVGGATLLRAAGADDGLICLMGRWRSLPACLGYQEISTAAHDRMSSLLLTPGIYTTRDIEMQYCVPRHTIEH